MKIEVRRAGHDDLSIIAGHRAAAESESSAYRGHLDEPGPVDTTVVVTFDGRVVGSLSYADRDSVRHLSGLHVDADYRGVGAGDALMQWVLEDAERCGITVLRSAALPGDRQSKNLFERHGLVARAIQVERRID